ncbi:MAG: LamG domain-containing protein, partial [Armatimonadetes bacterium]|nr:LamG domain-containing protein [Armatimonadota bacterium]
MRISLLIVILYCTPLFALGTEDVLFHAPFEGAPDAHLAAGDGKAITAGELQYTDGVRGRAVIVGGPAPADGKGKPSSIMYQTDSNLLIEEGSVSLWVKAIDWKIPDGHNHQFLTIPGTGVTYYLYVFYPGNTWWLLLKKDGNRPIGSYEPAWAPGEWHHLVATWREGEMAVYVDGEQTGRATENVPLPSAYGKNFWMGQFDNFHTAFDELIIFRKALTPVEVKALYSSVAKAPAPASAVIGDDPNSPAQVAGLLDSVTGQVVLDEDVTAQLWADEQTLHVKLCWAIPEYFRLNPTAYNGRALKRGAEALAENDAF